MQSEGTEGLAVKCFCHETGGFFALNCMGYATHWQAWEAVK